MILIYNVYTNNTIPGKKFFTKHDAKKLFQITVTLQIRIIIGKKIMKT